MKFWRKKDTYLDVKSEISVGREGSQVVRLSLEVDDLNTEHQTLSSDITDARSLLSTKD